MKMLPSFDAIEIFYMSLQNKFDFLHLLDIAVLVYNAVNQDVDVWTFDAKLNVWIFQD